MKEQLFIRPKLFKKRLFKKRLFRTKFFRNSSVTSEYWALCLVSTILTACSGGGLPPVSERSPALGKPVYKNGVFQEKHKRDIPASYTVQAGDTLYSIAWRFDKDFKDLARYNTIAGPYLIQPGQRLSLSGYSTSRPKVRERKQPALSRPAKKPVSKTAQKEFTQTVRSQWRWPASGPTLRAYGNNNAGVDIQVKQGSSVIASASGEVVYAGRGLRGFQHLIIIKHSEQYLSAYGVNQNILVKEGQLLGVGASLADITIGGTAQQTLHFEIRKDGDHVNPAAYIKN